MSDVPGKTQSAPVWRRTWQVPAFVAAAMIFAGGAAQLAVQHEPITFEQKCAKIDTLERAGAFTRAHAYVVHLLQDRALPDEKQGELFRRLIGITYKVEASQRIHLGENLESITNSFRRAVHLGATPTGFDWYALARTYDWQERVEDAEYAFRQALNAGETAAGKVRREMIEMLRRHAGGFNDQLIRELGHLIDNESAANRHYLWAVEQKTRWLLTESRIDEADELTKKAQMRLAGSADGPSVEYLRALCHRAKGANDEAEQTVRRLLRDWTARDDLWGRATWLLGMLHLEGDRPQAALNVFNDVISSFAQGDIHMMSLFGRAQALVALGRYRRSLDTFTELTAVVRSGRSHTVPPSQLIDQLTAAGDWLKRGDQLGLAIRFQELAGTLIPADAHEQQARSAIEIADAYVQLAYLNDDGESVAEPTIAFVRRAAEMYEAAAAKAASVPDISAQALVKAAEQFDIAGMRGRVIHVLQQLVHGFPARQGRATSMLRLGKALQADGRFAQAVEIFDALLNDYPRFPEALTARIPLAQCLLKLDDVATARGVKLLTDIVDDRGATTLFTPTADEYRQALFLLAEQLASGAKPAAPEDAEAFERRMAAAVGRLNQALGLYPDDPSVPQLIFLRAEAYRRTAESMAGRAVDDDSGDMRREIERRLTNALADYQTVQQRLAKKDEPALSAVERAYLRASYLYIGDCLFDIGNTAQAIEAYQEAAWRYENDPVAVSAAMQIVHGYVRLGRRDQSRAALGRLRWLLEKIPADSFDRRGGMSPKSYWMDLVDRMERMGV